VWPVQEKATPRVTGRPVTRPTSLRVWRPGGWRPSLGLTLAIPLVYLAVFGATLFREGDSDWDQILSFHELELWNTAQSGWAKQWNPLMQGGISMAGDPQVPIASLSMFLARGIDPAAAMKVAALIFVAAGALGAWLFAKDLGFDRRSAALAGALFAGNGYIVSRLSHGHVVFLGTLLLPLFLWANRRAVREPGEEAAAASRRLLGLILAGGAVFVLSTDGAPVSLLLLPAWVGLDAVLLSWQRRSARPILFVAGFLCVAAALDAVYYLPIAANALIFPRARAAAFIDPLVFIWFLVVPARGRVLPAPANGHEFSLYIGPIVAFLLVRYRREVWRAFPDGERLRLAAASAFFFVAGLGPWRALAAWLPPGPFDILHRLPGFIAMDLPSRLWGYLALPLALASAVAVIRFETEAPPSTARGLLVAALFLFTLGFQAVSLAEPFLTDRGKVHVRASPLPAHVTSIRHVPGPEGSQALQLDPARDLIGAYDHVDRIQGRIVEGSALVLSARGPDGSALPVRAAWDGWNRIPVELPAGASTGSQIVFNENYHPHWACDGAAATRNAAGNLCLHFPGATEKGARLTLAFSDPFSLLGARISACALPVYFLLTLGVTLWSVASPGRPGSPGGR
jgi:hypothetical protein